MDFRTSSSRWRRLGSSLAIFAVLFFTLPAAKPAGAVTQNGGEIPFAVYPSPAPASTSTDAACTPDSFILLPAQSVDEMQSAIRAIEAIGGCTRDVFAPSAVFGFIPAEAVSPLTASGVVAAVYHAAVSDGALTAYDDQARMAAHIWNNNYANPPAPEAQPQSGSPLNDDVRLFEAPVDQELLTAQSTAPGFYETSEFMSGSIAVGVIFPESSGATDPSTENWSAERMNEVMSEIQEGLDFWATNNPHGDLSFYYDVQYPVPTRYEPIARSSQSDDLWIADSFTSMGYTEASWVDQAYSYLNHIRTLYGTDWAVVAFVADSKNDADGFFTDGYFAYSYGLLLVMTYDNGDWGIEGTKGVFAHEYAHAFGAADEYCQPGYKCCSGGGQYGYLGIPNSNCEAGCDHNHNGICDGNDSEPNSGCRACPTCVETTCIMRLPLIENGLDTASANQVGMRDTDGDGILDPRDTTPALSLSAYAPDPTGDTTPTWSGTVRDVPYPTPTHVPVSINFINRVQFRIDGGGWADCAADDGTFDETEESFTCTPAALALGTHTIQVQARNRVSNLSNIASDTLTIASVPGNFGKSSPGNGATGVSLSPTLSWGSATGATRYEYCYDTTNDNACTIWTSVGTGTSVGLSGLNRGFTYYWQVRAFNAIGSTYANDQAAAFWSFTTVPDTDFGKSGPANGAANLSLTPTLSWGESLGATAYEYCYDITNDDACSNWTDNALSTSVTLPTLTQNKTYYWHVRAINATDTVYSNGSGTAFWSFSTLAGLPGSFSKFSPQDLETGIPINPNLNWTASSGAVSYEYCYDTTDDDTCSTWVSTGAATSAALSGLSYSTTYYWQARAVKPGGETYANSNTYWSFTVMPIPLPGNFLKSSPANGQELDRSTYEFSWTASQYAASYEICYDTINNNLCDATWISAGLNPSITINGLSLFKTYYWQMRAVNSSGNTNATGGWWSFNLNYVYKVFVPLTTR